MITVILKSGSRPANFSSRESSPQFYTHLYRINSRPQSWQPPTDLYETENVYIILVEIAGMQESDFDISIEQNLLNINGVRNTPVDERRAFHQMEIPFGDFLTQIELPAAIEIEKTEANYKNGFLMIILPKEKPKHIEINKE